MLTQAANEQTLHLLTYLLAYLLTQAANEQTLRDELSNCDASVEALTSALAEAKAEAAAANANATAAANAAANAFAANAQQPPPSTPAVEVTVEKEVVREVQVVREVRVGDAADAIRVQVLQAELALMESRPDLLTY